MAGTDIARTTDPPKSITFRNAQIIFRNFAGKEGQYNREGDRNFALVIPNEVSHQMQEDGWNVKIRPPREEGEDERAYLQISVSYRTRPPLVVMVTSRGRTTVPEEMLEILDWVDIEKIDLIINPYLWSVNGRTGTKAYLKSIYITIVEDELELEYADVPEIQGSAGLLEYTQDLQAIEAAQDPNIIDAEIVE